MRQARPLHEIKDEAARRQFRRGIEAGVGGMVLIIIAWLFLVALFTS